jgi:type IV pilus assembly protein PilA
MLARIRKAQENEGGFTLIELLVVMIIIGILAAIAIPVFLNQRKKANDTAGKADVSTLGKEVATYFVDNTVNPAVTGPASGRYTVNGLDAGKVSNNIALTGFHGNSGTIAGATNATAWCVDVTVTGGTQTNYKYSATNGLASGTCTSGTDF